MLKHIRSITVVSICLFVFISAFSCSSFSSSESDAGDPVVLAFGDPGVDTALMSPQEEESPLDDEELSQDLEQQKNLVLVERYLENAKNLKDQLKYEKAEAQLLKALDIDPSSSEVTKNLNEVQSLLGKKAGEIGEIKRLAAERYEVRKQQLKHNALDTFQKAKLYIDREEYARAIMYLENVINQINWSSYSVDWGSLKEDTEAKLVEAKQLKVRKETEIRRQQEREAFEKIRGEEKAQEAEFEKQISMLMDGAIDKMLHQDFDGAQELAEKVIQLDPKNLDALGLLDDVEEARHQINAMDYLSKRHEAYLKMKEDLEETRIPYFGVLTEAPEEEWARLTQLRTSEKVLGITDVNTPENRALAARLKNTRSDFNFEEDEITTVANVVHNFTGIPIVVDSEVSMELEDNAQTITLPSLTGVSVESLLNIICEQIGEGLTWTLQKGVVVITRQEKLVDNIQIRLHPIKDITFGLTTFRGPVIGQITPPDGTGEDAETSIFGGELEKQQPLPPEDVLNLIRENIARETCDMDMFNIDITQDYGSLLVIHTPEIQKKVADFLDDLRRFSSACVTIESRFIEINDSFIQEIGADFRGLGNDGKTPEPIMDVTNGFEDAASKGMDNQGDGGEGANPSAGIFFNDNTDGDLRFRNEAMFGSALGDVLSTIGGGAFQFSLIDDTMFNLVVRAVEKSYNATEITAPYLTVFNTQRSYITVINQVSFIQGFDVDVATSAFIANPNVGVIQEGIVLDVKPTVSYDRKYITLELQTTVADLKRPMRQRSTPLAGASTPVNFQLPELEVSTAATTVVVPDGGSLILGGLKRLRYISR